MTKIISNEEYEKALRNPNNIAIMNKAASKYRTSIDPDELYRCKLMALWGVLKKWKENGRSFTSFLYQRVDWECLNFLAKQRKTRQFSSIIPNLCENIDESYDIDNIVGVLPDEQLKNILIQRYVYNMTLAEIGDQNGFSYEKARKMIKKAISNLKTRFSINIGV